MSCETCLCRHSVGFAVSVFGCMSCRNESNWQSAPDWMVERDRKAHEEWEQKKEKKNGKTTKN